MQAMLRLTLLGLLAGLWLSLEDVQCDEEQEDASGDYPRPLCYDAEARNNEQDKDCKDSEDGQPLPPCNMSHYRHIGLCRFSDYGIIHVTATAANTDDAGNKHCRPICKKKPKKGEKAWCCLCINDRCVTICHKDNLPTTRPIIAVTTNTKVTKPIVPTAITYDSTIVADGSADSVSYKTEKPSSRPNEKPSNTQKTSSTEKPSSSFSAEQRSVTSQSALSPSAGQFDSPKKYQILLILLFFAVVVFIIVAIVLFIRKRKLDKRNDWSPVTFTSQVDTVTNVYAGVFPDNEPSGGIAPAAGNHIYDELDMMTIDPTPSNVYAEVQPTSVAVDMGRSVDYVDIDLPIKDQQKPVNTSKAPMSLSPIYSQPFEPSANNTEYAEPFKPDNKSTATAPVSNLYDNIAAVDQQNVYSLAEAIPLSDPNVIYSQPNKPAK